MPIRIALCGRWDFLLRRSHHHLMSNRNIKVFLLSATYGSPVVAVEHRDPNLKRPYHMQHAFRMQPKIMSTLDASLILIPHLRPLIILGAPSEYPEKTAYSAIAAGT